MEKFRNYLKLKFKLSSQSINSWVWIGRVAPLTALLVLMLILIFDITTWVDYAVLFISISFAVVAFSWWWWVIYTVQDIFKLLNHANNRFEKVIQELKDIKKEYFKKDNNKKR